MGWRAKLACLIFIMGTSLVCVADKFNFKYWSRIGIPYFEKVLRPVDLDMDSLLFAGYTKPPREGTTTHYGQSTTRPMLAHVRLCEESVLAPAYLIEFDPRACVDRLPPGIQEAIAAEFPDNKLDKGLYAMLLQSGVTDVYCTGTGYCHASMNDWVHSSGLDVSLIGFIGNEFQGPCQSNGWRCDGDFVIAGIFDPVGLQPIGMSANSLTTVRVSWPGTITFGTSGLRCAFDDFGFATSFYVVAMTKDKRRLMITHVLYAFYEFNQTLLRDQIKLVNDITLLRDQIKLVNDIKDVGQVIGEIALHIAPESREPIEHAVTCITGLALNPTVRDLTMEGANARQKRIAKLRLKRLMEELILGPYPTAQTIMLAHTALNKMLEVKEKPQPLPSSETLISEEKESTNVNLTKSLMLASPPLNKMPKPVEKPLPLPLDKTLIEIMAKPEELRTKQDRIMLKNAIRQGLIPAEENKKSQS